MHFFQTLPLGSRSGWELIGMEHGLRLWKRSGSDGGPLFATSAILPVSLEVNLSNSFYENLHIISVMTY